MLLLMPSTRSLELEEPILILVSKHAFHFIGVGVKSQFFSFPLHNLEYVIFAPQEGTWCCLPHWFRSRQLQDYCFVKRLWQQDDLPGRCTLSRSLSGRLLCGTQRCRLGVDVHLMTWIRVGMRSQCIPLLQRNHHCDLCWPWVVEWSSHCSLGDVGVGDHDVQVFKWPKVVGIGFKELAIAVWMRRALFEKIECAPWFPCKWPNARAFLTSARSSNLFLAGFHDGSLVLLGELSLQPVPFGLRRKINTQQLVLFKKKKNLLNVNQN